MEKVSFKILGSKGIEKLIKENIRNNFCLFTMSL